MKKSLNRIISLLVAMVFVLSLVPVIGMAAVTIPGAGQAATAMPWTGNNVPAASMKYADVENGVNRNSWSSIATNRLTHASEMAYSDGTFGKPDGDMVYLVRDWKDRVTADLTQAAAFFDGTVPRDSSKDKSTNDFGVEFSFALTDSTDKIQILTPMYHNYANVGPASSTGAQTSYRVEITPTYANIYGTKVQFDKALNLNQWYNLNVIYEVCHSSDGSKGQGNYSCYIYINSELYAKRDISTTIWGPRYVRIGTTSLGNSQGKTPDNWVHYDNLNTFVVPNADSFSPTKPVASTITSNNPDVQIIENVITAPKEYTLAQVKSALTSSKNDDVIRYYNSDYSAFKNDSDLALGTKIVLASLQNGVETTYANYSVEKYIKKFPYVNQDASAISKGEPNGAGYYSVTNETNGIGGKAADDKYIRMVDTSGNPYPYIATSNADAGNRDVLEFSIYVPDNAVTTQLAFGIYDRGTSYFEVPMLIKPDGLYTNFSTGAEKMLSWEANKWNHIAFQTPTPYDGSVDDNGKPVGDTLTKIYVNGVLKANGSFGMSRTGFRHIRFAGTTTTSDHINLYLDNVSCYAGTYEPKWDTLAEILYKDGIDENNNIIVKGKTTVSQLKAGISCDDETSIRVYSSLSTNATLLSDEDYVEDGNVVVAADKNGTEMERSYNYYNISKVNNEINVTTKVNGSVAKLYDADDTLLVNAEFKNYTNSDIYTAKMYVAQYKHNELVKVWSTDTKTVEAGQSEIFTCDFAGAADLTNSSIKVMIVDENLNPYVKAETMRYSNTNTKATLYLMGDSIVQTYDMKKMGYPIQGWGYYLEKYLNDNITVDNRGRSGWTTDHYLYPDSIYTKENGILPVGTELLKTDGSKKIVPAEDRFRIWDNIKSSLNPGDYIILALGINDAGSGNVPVERYRENIETIFSEANALGATVILQTPTITAGAWNYTGSFTQGYKGRGDICEAIAAEHNSVCLPLGITLVGVYNQMVADYQAANTSATLAEAKNYVRNYFHLYGASSTNPPPGWDDFGKKTTDDTMHYNFVGAEKVASIIAGLLKESASPLGDYVVLP